MAKITLQFQQREIAQYELTKKGLIRIGRSPDNDIVIDNMAVSGKHAQIIADETGFVIKDVGSWNGTFMDGQPIESRRLLDGDSVSIGKHLLVFSDNEQSSQNNNLNSAPQDAVPPRPPSYAADSTMFLDTRERKAMLDQYDRLGNKTPLLVVKYKEKILYKFLLKHQTTSIGRSPNNRVVIDNPAVSSQHAAITADKDGFTISDLNSRNGTFVNGKPVKTCSLHNGDRITVGRHDLVFEQAGTYTCDEVAQPYAAYSALNASTQTFCLNPRESMVAGSRPHEGKSTAGFSFLAGGMGFTPIEKDRFHIGKSKICDIVAKGLAVGDMAAVVTRDSDGYRLSYQSGLSKPMVNGRKIRDSIKLKGGDVIEIGSIKLEFNA